MRRVTFVFTLSLILTTSFLSAQMTPEEVVQKQLEAYNNRDIDSFMSVIAKNITLHDFSLEKLLWKDTMPAKISMLVCLKLLLNYTPTF